MSVDKALFDEALDGFVCASRSRFTTVSAKQLLLYMKRNMADRLSSDMLNDEGRLKIQIAAYLRSRMVMTKLTIFDTEKWRQAHRAGVNSFMVDKLGAVVAFTRSG